MINPVLSNILIIRVRGYDVIFSQEKNMLSFLQPVLTILAEARQRCQPVILSYPQIPCYCHQVLYSVCKQLSTAFLGQCEKYMLTIQDCSYGRRWNKKWFQYQKKVFSKLVLCRSDEWIGEVTLILLMLHLSF